MVPPTNEDVLFENIQDKTCILCTHKLKEKNFEEKGKIPSEKKILSEKILKILKECGKYSDFVLLYFCSFIENFENLQNFGFFFVLATRAL